MFTLVGIFYSFPFFFLLIFHPMLSLSSVLHFLLYSSSPHSPSHLVATFADLACPAPTHLFDPFCTARPTPAHRRSRLAQSPQTHLAYSSPSCRCPSLFSLCCDWVFCVCFHMGLVAVVVNFDYGSGGG